MKIKNFILGVFGIGLVIAVHEFGHWTFAQIFDVDTPEFSIGFGPVIAKKKIGKTMFNISALPIGGYVEISGVRAPVPGKEKQSFITKPYPQKALILLGGVIFNLLFAFLIFFMVGSPTRFVRKRIMRGEDESAFAETSSFAKTTEDKPEETSQVVGPIGIIAMASLSAARGFAFFFFFLAILSINLAFFNLLPLPIFDGGQLVILSSEAIIGKSLSTGAYDAIMTITTTIVIGVFLYITMKDIRRTFL